MPKTDFLVIGGAGVDIFADSNTLERVDISANHKAQFLCVGYGSKTNLQHLNVSYGGSAMNVALALKCLGSHPLLLTAIGDDFFGSYVLKKVRQYKLPSTHVKKKQGSTSIAIVLLSQGEKSVLVHHGAIDHLGPADITQEMVRKAKAIVITSMISEKNSRLFSRVVALAKKEKKQVVFAPSMTLLRCIADPRLLARYEFDISIMNREEAKCLTGKTTIKGMLAALPGRARVITDGSSGAYGQVGDERLHITNLRVTRRNTTGAGDTFCAGFIHTFYKTGNLRESLRVGTVVAAMKLTSTHPEVTCFPPEVMKFLGKYEKQLKITRI